AIYAVAIAFSVPVGTFLTIVGGFLFGTVAGGISVVFGATIGAICLFLAARYALYDYLHAKAGPALLKMEQGFKKNALSYLLFLRLVPLFPFWLVNLVAALLDVPLKIYVIATFIGIIPATFIIASVGNGLGEILAAGDTPDASVIFEPHVLIPILGLAFLALIPVFYKAWKARKDKNQDKS
ncbi:MAG: VTT domain-containing protein, partial [Alphaproteobacteria bacterium]